eukprot:608016-Rhodomonas_salina.1
MGGTAKATAVVQKLKTAFVLTQSMAVQKEQPAHVRRDSDDEDNPPQVELSTLWARESRYRPRYGHIYVTSGRQGHDTDNLYGGGFKHGCPFW